MIDCDGFRPNVGLILCNSDRLVFWGKRVGQDAWQFPQGGIHEDESPEQAALRELQEETGLRPEHVRILGVTKRWYRYRLPSRMVRRGSHPVCIGQKQRWYLLELLGDDQSFALDASDQPEFDDWRWIDYWRPSREVVYFKREVYRRALCELAPLMFPEAVRAFRRARGELVTQGGGASAAADRDF